MIVISVLELRLKPERVGSADDILRDTLNDTRARPGCLGVEVAIDVDDPAHIVVVEKWESLEADDDYRAWRASPEGASALGSVIAEAPALSRSLLRDDI
ncbi:putative quinol monooxygenase [Herbiconiux sp. A18JL235]|uniref:Quinol monooxygenase n=1 Tax=Herbiconiux sp. A18JL235 TaxID=3152363 RepID=A0AB39BHP2_9MICO